MALGYRAAIPSALQRAHRGWEAVPRTCISRRLLIGLLAIGSAWFASGCATRPTEPEAQAEFDKVNDPGEPTNRAIFGFNQAFDRNLFKPVAQAYQDNVPDPVRHGVHNFLTNLDEPLVGFNDLLQANGTRALTAGTRFLLNTTIGMAGIFDLAGEWGLAHHDADFGQTFGVWGIGEGPFITLPIFGPSNPRDAVGMAFSFAANPLTWMSGTAVTVAGFSRGATQGIDERARNIDALNDLERNSLDFYATLRSVYRQHRNGMVEDAKGGDPNAHIEFGYPRAEESGK
jgi:phospholipid-binding lipoprotein MlaA